MIVVRKKDKQAFAVEFVNGDTARLIPLVDGEGDIHEVTRKQLKRNYRKVNFDELAEMARTRSRGKGLNLNETKSTLKRAKEHNDYLNYLYVRALRYLQAKHLIDNVGSDRG